MSLLSSLCMCSSQNRLLLCISNDDIIWMTDCPVQEQYTHGCWVFSNSRFPIWHIALADTSVIVWRFPTTLPVFGSHAAAFCLCLDRVAPIPIPVYRVGLHNYGKKDRDLDSDTCSISLESRSWSTFFVTTWSQGRLLLKITAWQAHNVSRCNAL